MTLSLYKKALVVFVPFAAVVVLGALWLVYTEGALPPPLVVTDRPVSVIGDITAVAAGSITVVAQPPGNTEPVVVVALVDEATVMYMVGPAPAYATSTIGLADLSVGQHVNLSASGALGGVRRAECVVVPPAQ